ncbi:peroxidasin homolog [Diadema setosum]|uniref:peroxidasin homolog n=1 Tax=Diadema setosum TaxID=31175 RepID=UPI003B3AB21E
MPAIEVGPQNITILTGQDALFTCTIRMKGMTPVFWYRSSSGSRISTDWTIDSAVRRPNGREYLIEGDRRRGEINLKLPGVEPSDAGEYHCGFPNGGNYVRKSAFLSVLVPPLQQYPRCELPDRTSWAVGQTVELVCMSDGGTPPAKLVWLKDETELTDGHEQINTYKRLLTLGDLQANFICRAESPALSQPRTCTTSITLENPSVVIHPRSYKAEVGDSVTFMCTRQDWPRETRFRWFFRNNPITPTTSSRFNISEDSRALTIDNVQEADGGSHVECRVTVLPGLEYPAVGTLLVSRLTGEVLGTLGPPRLQTRAPTIDRTPSQPRILTAASGMTVGDTKSKRERDATPLIAVLGAVGGLLVVIAGVITNYAFVRQHRKKKEQETPPRSEIRPVGSGVSLMTTKPSDRSLASSDSATTSTATTTTTVGKREGSAKAGKSSKPGSPYAELDADGMRLSEYQGLNAPPNLIYAEPMVAPTKLVPRPQHQEGFHDYALPDILPELSVNDYVEPDPPPRSKKVKQPEKGDGQAPNAKVESDKPTPQNTDGVYIEIIA